MIYFFYGIIFAYLILPLLENISGIMTQFSEFICVKIAEKTFEIKKRMNNESIQSSSNVIGFQYTPSEEEYYEEEEE